MFDLSMKKIVGAFMGSFVFGADRRKFEEASGKSARDSWRME